MIRNNYSSKLNPHKMRHNFAWRIFSVFSKACLIAKKIIIRTEKEKPLQKTTAQNMALWLIKQKTHKKTSSKIIQQSLKF